MYTGGGKHGGKGGTKNTMFFRTTMLRLFSRKVAGRGGYAKKASIKEKKAGRVE